MQWSRVEGLMELVVNTEQGKVQGAVEKGAIAFLGIPYAAPPVGEGRFAPPQPPESWEGIRETLGYGATALQPHQEFTLIPEPMVDGDNCLNLNVFTPDPGIPGCPCWCGSTVVGSSPAAAPARGTGESVSPVTAWCW